MFCPVCKEKRNGNFCPECGTKLIEEPVSSQNNSNSLNLNLNLGDANAISGGLHVNNTTHIVERTKTQEELVVGKEKIYINQCKRCLEDFIITNEELSSLESLRLELGLTKDRANELLESVRSFAMRANLKGSLTGVAKIKAKQFSDAIKKNNVQLIKQMLPSMEVLVSANENEELHYKFYMALAALEPEHCIELYNKTSADDYWLAYWTYISHVKLNNQVESEKILVELEAKYFNYPSDNATILATAGVVIIEGVDGMSDYLEAIEGDYSPILQTLVDALCSIGNPHDKILEFYLENILPVCSAEEKLRRQEETLQNKMIEESRRIASSDNRMYFNEDCSILKGIKEEARENLTEYELPLCVKQIGAVLNRVAEEDDDGDCGFSRSNLKKIKLHDKLEIIAGHAFHGTDVEELIIPSYVTKIESYAFSCTENLVKIVLPECSINTEGLFWDTPNLRKVELPSTIKEIGKYAFQESGIEEIVIPEGVKEIKTQAFQKTSNLKRITLPSTLQVIEKYAFKESGIEEIVIPEGVKEIKTYAFMKTSNLKRVTLPSTLQVIEKYAFKSSVIKEIIIPEGNLECISQEAFCETYNLRSIKLPSTLKIIGESAFYKSGIVEINIPEGITTIERDAFRETINLKSIALPSSLNEIGKCAFDRSGIEEIIIPEGVITLEDAQFYFCKKLRKVVLPKSLLKLGDVFGGCANIKDVYMSAPPRVFEVRFRTKINLHLLDNDPSLDWENVLSELKSSADFYVSQESYYKWEKLFGSNFIFKVLDGEKQTNEYTKAIEENNINDNVSKDQSKAVKVETVKNSSDDINLSVDIESSENINSLDNNLGNLKCKTQENEIDFAITAINNNDTAKAKESVSILRKHASNNIVNAQFYLGYCYHKGIGVKQNDQFAVMWYKKAGKQGHALAQLNLGLIKNDAAWFRRAANQGIAEAKFRLGLLYIRGLGVVENRDKGIGFIKEAAKQNYEEAVNWLKKADLKTTESKTTEVPKEKSVNETINKDQSKAVSDFVIKKRQERDDAWNEYSRKRTQESQEKYLNVKAEYKKVLDAALDGVKTVDELKKIIKQAKQDNEKEVIAKQEQEKVKLEKVKEEKVKESAITRTANKKQPNIIIDQLWIETDGKSELFIRWYWTANNMDGCSLRCRVNMKAKSGKELKFKYFDVNKMIQVAGNSYNSKTGISISHYELDISHDEEKKIEFNIEFYDSKTNKCVYSSKKENFNIWYYFNFFSANEFKLRSANMFLSGNLTTRISFI